MILACCKIIVIRVSENYSVHEQTSFYKIVKLLQGIMDVRYYSRPKIDTSLHRNL
jgi:hypothetical protein